MESRTLHTVNQQVRPPSVRTVGLIWLAGSSLALLIILANAGGSIHRTAFGDGEIYRYIAENITIQAAEVHPVVVERGTSLRFGRIGLPAAIWLLSAGQRIAMPYAHVFLIAIAAGGAGAAALHLMPGLKGRAAFLPWIAPGFALSIVGGFADVAAIALALWGTVFVLQRRWGVALLVLAAGILVKEATLAVLVGLVIWLLWRRQVRGLIILAASLIPITIWYLVVRQRYGHIPLLDPYLDEVDGPAGTPVLALWRSLTDPPHASGLVTALIHLALAAVPVSLARTSVYAVIGAIAGVQVLASGPFAWEFIGEAFRVLLPLQVFAIFAVAARLRRSDTNPAALGPGVSP